MAWENNDSDGGGIWAIESGASHSARLARLQAWASLGGNQGVLGSTHLAVQPLAVPGTKVRVAPGACAINNRALNSDQETYLARLFAEDELDIAATGSGVSRSDLIVVRIENPYIDGEPWQIPPSEARASGPYGGARVIPNVPANTTSVRTVDPSLSAITLARIDVPPSTGTIQTAMIHDLRSVVNPITGGVQGPPGGGGDGGTSNPPPVVIPGDGDDGDNDDGDTLPATQTTYVNWPAVGTWDLHVPSWATVMDLLVVLENVQVRQGDLAGLIRLLLDGIPQIEQLFHATWPNATVRQNVSANYPNLPIDPALRGTTVHFDLQAKVTAATAGRINFTDSSKVKATATFKQTPTAA